ncbi:MAG TPA: sugar phosphate isomerase/epimerase family protein [Candidatus Methylomirabilis sp.]
MFVAGHTMGTPDMTPEEALALFARIGCAGSEFVCQEGYRCGVAPALDAAARRRLRQAASARGVPVVALTPYQTELACFDDALRSAQVDGLIAAVRLAADLGAGVVRAYGSKEVLPPDRARAVERLVRSLREAGTAAAEAGVKIALENHYGTLTVTAAQTVEVVRAVGMPSVGILYDQANIDTMLGEAWPEALALQQDFIVHVHVKDFEFKGERRASDTAGLVSHMDPARRAIRSRVIGEGVVPWAEILPALAAAGYAGPVSIEYSRRWYPEELPEPEEGIARCAAHLHGILSALREGRPGIPPAGR